MILPIVKVGDPILNEVCVDVDLENPEIKTLIIDMVETLNSTNGCGLAASQVGKPYNLFIISFQDFHEIFINPKITAHSTDTCIISEGCLSVPGEEQDVERPTAVKIEYYDINFVKQSKAAAGILARIIQHEYDHTKGILYTSRL
jgi:peptide deformylase